ncbi:MAG: hypothetical protein BKP49_10505 [Treponema sp. CETP13]|nr:MAG: hypothetical protein BKP49_10505 [Treponema sp. CETP13]
MNRSRPHRLAFRASDDELTTIRNKQKLYGLTQQELCLQSILNSKIYTTDLSGIKEFIPQLKRVGNNLNQIVHVCNCGYEPLYEKVSKELRELEIIWQLLKQYLAKQA